MRDPMFHHVARARHGLLLFDGHDQARVLWEMLARTLPHVIAMCLMPDHVHVLLPDADEAGRIRAVMSGFARWKNALCGTTGPWWDPKPGVEPITDEDKRRRQVRYLHLNPCREGLAEDPLAWPWSTHRDRVGFAWPAVGPVERTPAAFHKAVSGDPSVAIGGTELPELRFAAADWQRVRDVVLAVTRADAAALRRRGPVRTLALRTAWVHEIRDVPLLARLVGSGRDTVYRAVAGLPPRGARMADPALRACVNGLGDPRFEPFVLRATAGWGQYRWKSAGVPLSHPERLGAPRGV